MLQHSAIYVASKIDKNQLVQQLVKGRLHEAFSMLPTLKGEVFSKQVQQAFIDEELKHEHFQLQTNGRQLTTHSDGEQKKALLQFLLTKQLDFIIIDNVFDNLDTASQEELIHTLIELSRSTTIIQLTNRNNEVLPFIEQFFSFHEGQLLMAEQELLLHQEEPFHLSIPPPIIMPAAQQNPLVQFKDVSVSYEERPILNHINWTINAGEFWQLTGPIGSGKSTLLSMIIGDNPKAYNQDLILFGKKKGTGETVWEIKAKIGYVNSMMTHLFARRNTIEEMIVSGFNDSIGLYNKPSSIQIQLAADWLKVIGLFQYRNKAFVDLSEGQQRLVMITRAMVKHPPLLILDEPTIGLDDHDAAIFVAMVNKIAAETNTAIIYVSHRKENGLKPGFVFELVTRKEGSTGKQRKS